MLIFYTFLLIPLLGISLYVILKEILLTFKSLPLFSKLKISLVFLIYLTMQVFFFPGFIDGDLRFILSAIRNSKIEAFHGLFYSSYVNLFEILNIQFFAPVYVQLLISFYTFLKIEQYLSQDSKGRFWALKTLASVVFYLSPLTIGLVLYYSRDALLAVSATAFFIYIYENKNIFDLKYKVFSSLVFFVICNIRQEAIVMFWAAPILYYIYKIIDFKQMYKILAAFIFIASLHFYIMPLFLKKTYGEATHRVTMVLNPLGQILYETDFSEYEKADLENIDRVVQLECFKKYYDPFEIQPLHMGCLSKKITYEKEFYLSVLSIFWKHLDIWTQNRINMFLVSANIKPGGHAIFANEYPYHDWQSLEQKKNIVEIRNSFQNKNFGYLIGIIKTGNAFVRVILFSLLFSLVFSVFVLSKYFNNKLVKIFIGMVILRCTFVFLFAPAAYFKYYHLLYFICCTFALVSLEISKEQKS